MKIMDATEIQKLEGQRIGILVLERGVIKVIDAGKASEAEVQQFVTENVTRYHEAVLVGVYERVAPPIQPTGKKKATTVVVEEDF